MKLVLAAEYNDEVTANIARGMFESNGIPAVVEGSNMVSVSWRTDMESGASYGTRHRSRGRNRTIARARRSVIFSIG